MKKNTDNAINQSSNDPILSLHQTYNPENFQPVLVEDPETIEFLIIDLFCGAGGTTTGFANAELNGKNIALIAACVNHDPIAIKSHWRNHPKVVHFEEDIRTLNLSGLKEIVVKYRILYPQAKVILWASLECTNFSKAKGGQPRDADSRTLAENLYMHYDPIKKEYYTGDSYIQILNPDYIMIENVVEFMSWGPLDEKGKPVSKKSGSDWMRWRQEINELGYQDQWKEINSADFGAYTSRNRLFGCFAKEGLPIVWPEPTHSKKPTDNGLFGNLKKWKPVKDVLDLADEGISIFNRKKPLVDASFERIEAGLIKFVAGGKDSFLLKYNSMSKSGDRKQSVMSVENPAPTIPCQNRTGMCFIAKYYSGKPSGKVISVSGPAGTIRTADGQSLITCQPFILNTNFKNVGSSIDDPAQTLTASRHHPYVVSPAFLAQYYSSGGQLASIEEPARTLGTRDTISKIQPVFFDKTFSGNGNSNQYQSIEQPAGTIMPNDKHRLINCIPFVYKQQKGKLILHSKQDGPYLYLIDYADYPWVSIPVYKEDSAVMIRIKKFMALFGLSDIKMRMLKVPELLLIQGLTDNNGIPIKLEGNQTHQKKQIGNSVHPLVPKAKAETLGTRLRKLRKEAA